MLYSLSCTEKALVPMLDEVEKLLDPQMWLKRSNKSWGQIEDGV